MKKAVLSEAAPRPVGPYSQAIVLGTTIYCSGQIGLDPATGRLVSDRPEEQTKQCLLNLRAVLEAAGFSLRDVVKTTVFVTDMNEFKLVNEAYSSFFPEDPPARSAIGVAALPLKARVEIEGVAVRA